MDEQEGVQDAYDDGPQSPITSEISNKSKSDQEAEADGISELDIGPPPSICVPISMSTIEIGDISEENIDFSAAGPSGASNSGLGKHARDPVDDVRSSGDEEDDDVKTALVCKWSRADRGSGKRRARVRGGRQQVAQQRARVRGGRQQGGQQIRARGVKARILSKRHHDMVGRMRGRGRPPGRVRGYTAGVWQMLNSNNNNDNNEWEWELVDGENEEDNHRNIVELEDHPFAEIEGLRPVIRLPDEPSTLDFVQLYLTDNIFNILVAETNSYAHQFLAAIDGEARPSYSGKWTPVTLPEIKKIIGVIFLMGVIYKPTIPMYWVTEEIYWTPAFSVIMTRTRFQLILKILHFNDNLHPNYDPNAEDRDKLHKVRPIIDELRRSFKTVWSPERNLSVDESLVLYKGRLQFRQYIKTKRARFGIKLYELTTSDGITLDFLVYCGKGMFHNDDPNSDMPTTERIPSVLMAPYLGKGHVLYTDNWYTSPTLASFLLSKQTYLCGTVKSNRKHFPKNIVNHQLEKGTAVFMKRCSGRPMICCKFRALKDKANGQPKVVHMLSTFHDAIVGKTGKVDHKSGVEIVKPCLTIEYNKHMGGVDRVDQQLHSYNFLRKS